MIALLPFVAQAQVLQPDDSHLDVVPRTKAEIARIKAVTAPPTDFSQPQKFEENSAGAASVRVRDSRDAFSAMSGNMPFARELDFKVGNGIFRKLWVSSPSSTLASDGLGPLFNARSCQRCHLKDGRGHPPEPGDENAVSFLMRISVPTPERVTSDLESYLSTRPDPVYGSQIQDAGLAGHKAEARIGVSYTETEIPLSGGEIAVLRKPLFTLDDLGYGPLAKGAVLSPRVAPQMIGLGLLEAIPAADILSREDPDDADGDGISGRANIVWSAELQRPMLGRFGLKAGQPSIRDQTAAAFLGDIGISSSLHDAAYGDCTPAQDVCVAAVHGDQDERVFEVDSETLDLVTFYSRNLGVPKRRNVNDPQVLRGKQVFYQTGCTACHTPNFVTNRLKNQPEQSFQLIWPYTDMLLHDMGAGLADNAPEARASGSEWRTPPLWGIGLTKDVSGHTRFLHDGRARNLLEAVLWHGGEAQASRDTVIQMPPSDRAALIRFLESL
ncbi:di-heme oxidoredictase family protein [Neptunicoccus sediminis]|uniref:di-heme oxidoreductase family protein n=1 Tax=Neptunicoccus sediminis TaxID=1892596 RepID=UPI000845CAE9|nr:di-heme oxidoredictase family protein [Neptunicoccus sediminis]